MPYLQTQITLPAHQRGVHIITPHITQAVSQLVDKQTDDAKRKNKSNRTVSGLVHLFLQHTSASLAINENADPDVRLDTEDWLNKIAPADQPEYRHTFEGSDDLPAHFKSMMFGVSLTIPLIEGRLGLGVWQGVYLCEHRNHASGRKLIITVGI
ncbi:secondary thiamine-phosphate synthase enzyme YjbQ [Psychrobacter sp. I-STPA10]|uniref:secondary thiamine-phosphate synthase enzyme YjbQ n=1 Tax=Psychrobacter sp. I-STPA10 TaxID=2585769 RepID=UPI001E65A9A6|nr:secondary thiamine-phosphate synthase enzyme YjbQ [Psychrobacter sp. I-STPA10]